ncbi:hypothetical protein BD780_003471 [Clostridium tetanomorphum]|uniref:hypothetical protein n=1 Tax=Clostridium tetanomorphum TaxID=1553 RepID=UPI0004455264|nr:hypothetical protein [Clostridium tetanomorphum]KAJ48848.1 hypothetical protein CTM_26237 [Clostridium tetanomorphum DSM 665]KAJ51240.1 hypothetical protein CTM_14008 [Clostridium tetanomorphum DSM 665]MBP1863670.1 hypothetical protein [Clostridium tetanomorphum]NRS86246.1 hypothetical protein [Clostridium tetanomorphum]SQC00747.1 Uncharacterised protein [Clostridium tetanomorphum]
MRRTLKQTIFAISLSNTVALAIFYLMYKFGVSIEIPLVQQYFMIPLAILVGYLVQEDYKELRKVQQTVI